MIHTVALWVAVACAAKLLLIFPGYGLILRFLALFHRKRVIAEPAELPAVTLIISAYNEEAVLEEKLRNALELDYLADRFRILVVSDSSTDRTDDIVREFEAQDPRVRLLRVPERGGKTLGLNQAMETVDTPLVVFSDANAMYQPSAIRLLVRHFSDPRVGYVVGAAIYTDDPGTEGARTEGRYWSKELRIKELESRVSSVVGGDGAIYAIRAELYEPLRRTDINDYVNPMQIICKGYRGVFEPEARCFEHTTGLLQHELRRKRRIVNRSFAGLLRTRSVLNPFRFGWFSVQVWFHKVLRWVSPLFALLGLAAATVAAFGYSWLIAPVAVTWASLLLLSLVLVGWLPGRGAPVLATGTYALGVAVASVRGIGDLVRGRITTTWETPRVSKAGRRPAPVAATLGTLFLALCPFALVLLAFVSRSTEWSIAVLAVAGVGAAGHAIVYGLLLDLFQRLRGKPKPVEPQTEAPSVTLLIAAFNEEKILEEKLENALRTEYPGSFQIVVGSDGSSDATDDIARRFAERGVRLFRNPVRTGKAGMLRRALVTIDTDVVVFSDANALYDPKAIRHLAARFADPGVGAVTGSVKLLEPRSREPEEEVWLARLEKRLMRIESRHGSCVGVDGAMVAVRRKLACPFEDGTILDDFVLAIHVVNLGYRVVFEPAALGAEMSAPTLRGEYERRARILAGITQLYMRRMGLPLLRSGLVMRFLGHKVWRWCAPLYSLAFGVCLVAAFGWLQGAAVLIGGLVFLYVALAFLRGFRLAALKIGYLLVYQAAGVVGFFRGLAGRQSGAWRRTER